GGHRANRRGEYPRPSSPSGGALAGGGKNFSRYYRRDFRSNLRGELPAGGAAGNIFLLLHGLRRRTDDPQPTPLAIKAITLGADAVWRGCRNRRSFCA